MIWRIIWMTKIIIFIFFHLKSNIQSALGVKLWTQPLRPPLAPGGSRRVAGKPLATQCENQGPVASPSPPRPHTGPCSAVTQVRQWARQEPAGDRTTLINIQPPLNSPPGSSESKHLVSYLVIYHRRAKRKSERKRKRLSRWTLFGGNVCRVCFSPTTKIHTLFDGVRPDSFYV